MGPFSWSLLHPKTPLIGPDKKGEPKQLGLIGDGCTMCSRHKKRVGEGVQKPKLYKGNNDSERILLVFSYNSYGLTVDRIVDMIRTFHDGHILVDLPVRCGEGNVTEVQMNACRHYLVKSFQEFKPDRIVLFGGRASTAALGMAVPAWANRWCWTTLPGFRDKRIPVVVTMDPTVIARSKVHTKIIENELRWALLEEFPDARPTGNAYVIETEDDFWLVDKWLETARKDGWLAYDVETNGVPYNNDFSIIACALSSPSNEHVLVWDFWALSDPTVVTKLKDILTDPSIGKRGSNIKYDNIACKLFLDITVTPVDGDSRLEMKQVNADSKADLESMGFYVGINAHKSEAKQFIKKNLKLAKAEMDPDIEGVSAYAYVYKYLPLDVMLRYNALDTFTTMKVCKYSRPALGDLEKTLHRLILPANELVTSIEEEGFLVDKTMIEESRYFLEKEIAKLAPKFDINGINPDSPASIREWLDRMEIESPLQTKTGLASTSKKALGLIRHRNEIIASILEHRKLAKLLSGYAVSLPGFIRADGRIHPSFLLDGARSGRLSCRSPSLHTIPSKGELAKLIKRCFVARPGWRLVAADFSILEIRVSAILSRDPAMLKAAQGDFHTETAKSISQLAWKMTSEAVEAEIRSGNKSKRDIAKTLGFAILYGAGPDTIAERVGCSPREAVALIEAFFSLYSRLQQWLREQVVFAREHAMVEIPWLDGTVGRIRPLLDIASADSEARGNAQRASGNSPIQSLASDICLSSAVRIHQLLRKKNIPANIVGMVHDSIITEVREDWVDEVVRLKNHCMTDWPTQGVPLKVEIEVGQSWGGMEAVSL